MTDPNPLLELKAVSKEFDTAAGPNRVLSGVDLTVNTGDTVAIVGPSGCGKSTLLNIIGALDRPTSGTAAFEGRDIFDRDDKGLARFRNESIGYVFQLHHLLPQCTALENVLVPTLVHRNASDARVRALELLERVGLADRAGYRPGVLSGGERQRVAVVRALINRPRLLLADEPTGSLSATGADDLTRIMLELNQALGMALIVVTHSAQVAESMDRVLELQDGRLNSQAGGPD